MRRGKVNLTLFFLRTVFGAAAATFNNAFAAPPGSRLPCSQSCSVRTKTPPFIRPGSREVSLTAFWRLMLWRPDLCRNRWVITVMASPLFAVREAS